MKNIHIFFIVIILSIFDIERAYPGTSNIDKAAEDLIRQYQKEMEEIMKTSPFQNLGKMFDQMIQGMNEDLGKDLENFFQNGQFDNLLRDADIFKQMEVGQSEWIETPKERILVLKFLGSDNGSENSPGNSPVEIKVENGKIRIRGQIIVEKKESLPGGGESVSKNMTSINKEFLVPGDVDPVSVNFENKNGEILMKFTKKNIGPGVKPEDAKSKKPKPNKVLPEKINEKINPDERRPITPRKGDVTI